MQKTGYMARNKDAAPQMNWLRTRLFFAHDGRRPAGTVVVVVAARHFYYERC